MERKKLLNSTYLYIDPLVQPIVTAGMDHYFRTCFRPFIRPSVPTFKNLAKQNKVKTMFTSGETVGLGEWIIDDTFLVNLIFLKFY